MNVSIRHLLGWMVRDDAYPYFNVIRDGRNDHGKGATQLGRCAAVFLELSLWDS